MGLANRMYKMIGAQARKPSGWLGKVLFGYLATLGHKPLTNWAMGFLDVQSDDRVLDIGCGGGMAIKLIARKAPQGFVAGVDYSEDMVRQALRRNAAAVRAGRVEIRHGNAAALPYNDDSFDKIITVESFYFWPDPVANLREVLRVLRGPEPACPEHSRRAEGKPGGLVAIAMEGSQEAPNSQATAQRAAQMGFPLYSGTEMQEMLIAAGFSRAWFESVPDKGWGWLCALGVK